MANANKVCRPQVSCVGDALTTATATWLANSGKWGNLLSSPSTMEAGCSAPEWVTPRDCRDNLKFQSALHQDSLLVQVESFWVLMCWVGWFHCNISVILCFLLPSFGLQQNGFSPSTLKVHLTAISACHVEIDDCLLSSICLHFALLPLYQGKMRGYILYRRVWYEVHQGIMLLWSTGYGSQTAGKALSKDLL